MNEPVCGIGGDEAEVVTVGKLNRWLAFAFRHHLLPLKESIRITAENTNNIALQVGTLRRDQEQLLNKIDHRQKMTLMVVTIGVLVMILSIFGIAGLLYIVHTAMRGVP